MTTSEKLAYYAASGLMIGLVGLRIFHLIDPGWGMIGVLFGAVLVTNAYSRYARRLARRNEELEEELERLQRTLNTQPPTSST